VLINGNLGLLSRDLGVGEVPEVRVHQEISSRPKSLTDLDAVAWNLGTMGKSSGGMEVGKDEIAMLAEPSLRLALPINILTVPYC
jgi:hypothetical protein